MLEYVAIFYLCLVLNVVATLARLWDPSWKDVWKDCWRLRPHKHHSKPTTAPLEEREDQTRLHKQTRIHRKLLYATYLPVYLLAVLADWLQGPYKYALYSAYGYTQSDIATLFVAGFGSGMVLGSLVGGYADRMGRRKLAFVYCLAYCLSVSFKHCQPFPMLLLGRVMGGIATSLLYSVFDAWLIKAHATRGLAASALVGHSFSVATYGSSVVAILGGIIANAAVMRSGPLRPMFLGHNADEAAASLTLSPPPQDGNYIFFKGGYLVPFDLTLIPLVLCAVLALILWEENYGDKDATNNNKNNNINNSAGEDEAQPFLEATPSIVTSEDDHLLQPVPPSSNFFKQRFLKCWGNNPLQQALHTVWHNPNILRCCIISSLFEGSMYVFIFMWTPALTALEFPEQAGSHVSEELPLGYIFATFMVCCMIGTSAFSYSTEQSNTKAGLALSPPTCLVYILGLSACACVAMAVTTPLPFLTTAQRPLVPYLGMLLLEACIGAYFPAMGTVKSTVVPEHQRSAIYNVFRLPLNFIVLLNLAVLGNMTHVQSFLLCGVMLGIATVLQYQLTKRLVNDTVTTSRAATNSIGNNASHDKEMQVLTATTKNGTEEKKEDIL